MYQSSKGLGVFNLARALTPPAWLRNAVSQRVGSQVKGTIVSIPTEAGTISFDLSDPKQWTAIANMVKGIRVSKAPASPAPSGGPVDAIPGGWMTLALIGVGLFALSKARR
jgi:hypothetical protein